MATDKATALAELILSLVDVRREYLKPGAFDAVVAEIRDAMRQDPSHGS